MLAAIDVAKGRPLRGRAFNQDSPVRAMARAAVLAAVGLTLALAPSIASAYQQPADPRGELPCEVCHTSWSGGSDPGKPGSGPHGNYTSDTTKCGLCHTVHAGAASSIKLLPAATIHDACFSCHDATGAYGVYGEVLARTGASPASSHSIDATTQVPGGSTALTGNLTCTSCHSAHGNTQMTAFPQMKQFAAEVGWPVPSNRILRDDVGGHPEGTYTKYGGAWCAGCHDQRSGGHMTVNNHPTTETVDAAGVFGADTYPDLFPTEFVMEDTIPVPPARHEPYCQQCHWNSVDVEAAIADGYFTYDYSRPDLTGSPMAAAFPHETQNPNMRIEPGDDLCLNCHTELH